MKDIICKIINPHKIIICISIPIIIILMLAVYVVKISNPVFVYSSYAICGYLFTVFCIWFGKNIGYILKEKIYKNEIINKVLKDNILMNTISLSKSLVISIVYVLFNLIAGIYYQSIWFITFAIYYLLLILMRGSLLKPIKSDDNVDKNIIGYKKYRMCGIVLLFMNILLSAIIALIILQNETFHYAGYLIYVVALYTFYITINGVRNLIKNRKYKNPIISATTTINVMASLISMLSLEVAMLTQFGQSNSREFFITMIGATGGAISIIFIIMSLVVIIKSNKYLKENRKQID